MAVHTLESLGKLGFRLPDRQMVLQALAPTDERCPSCKKHRNAADFIYVVLPEYQIKECACYHCLTSTETAQNLGTSACVLASDRYIDSIVSQCVLGRWLLVKERKRDIPLRQWLELGIADVVGKNWGDGCTGSWARVMSPSGTPFDTHLPCCDVASPNRRKYWTRNGLVCGRCLKSSTTKNKAAGAGYKGLAEEIKQRLRLVCEGARYAVWLANLERYVPDIEFEKPNQQKPWSISWFDWLRCTEETTEMWETGSIAEHKRYRFV